MSKKLISFLGTNNYIKCNYYYRDEQRKASGVKYVQEAMVKLMCKDWTENDSIIIMLTEEAKEKNWFDNGHFDKEGKNISNKGLKKRLESLKLKTRIVPVGVPEGKSEDELWIMFEKIFQQIQENDEVIFDITNAFRSIPIFAVIVLNYARIIKNIKISNIYYGAFDILGKSYEVEKMPLEKRNAPIFNLTPLIGLMDWTTAVNNFVRFGISEDINKLCTNMDKEEEEVTRIKEFGEKLYELDMNIRSCRIPDVIGSKITGLKEIVCNLMDEYTSIPTPVLKPLFEKVLDKISVFTDKDLENGYAAVDWCIEHDLVQQGFTILKEMVLSTFLKGCVSENKLNKQNIIDYISQDKVRKKLNLNRFQTVIKDGKINHNKIKSVFKRENIKHIESKINNLDKICNCILVKSELLKANEELSKYRNYIDHAGYTKDDFEAEKLKEKLKESYDEIMRLI